MISSPRDTCESSLDGGVTIAAPGALHCFTSPSVLHPVGCGGRESSWGGGDGRQVEGGRGSPNPQLCPLDLPPLKSQRGATAFGTAQRRVSQFVSSAAFAAKVLGWFFLLFLFSSFFRRLVYGRQDLTGSWHLSHPQQMPREPKLPPLPRRCGWRPVGEGLSLQGKSSRETFRARKDLAQG